MAQQWEHFLPLAWQYQVTRNWLNATYQFKIWSYSSACRDDETPRRVFFSLSLGKAQWDDCNYIWFRAAWERAEPRRALRAFRLAGSWMVVWNHPWHCLHCWHSSGRTVYLCGLLASTSIADANTLCICVKFPFVYICIRRVILGFLETVSCPLLHKKQI